jgi:hypothetical protein
MAVATSVGWRAIQDRQAESAEPVDLPAESGRHAHQLPQETSSCCIVEGQEPA